MKLTLTSPQGEKSECAFTDARPFGSWIDVDLDDGTLDEARKGLIDNYGLHPLAVDSVLEGNQRPRIDSYDTFSHLITIGMDDEGELFELNCFIFADGIVTVHRNNSSAFDRVRSRLGAHSIAGKTTMPIIVAFLIVDAVVDTYFPVLAQMDEEIDELENQILDDPNEEQLARLFKMKRRIMRIRKSVNPQRDMISALNSGVVTIPGMDEVGVTYFRNLFDHFIRISDMVDSYRDLITGAMETHLAMVNNRLNVVMKQLAIVSTIFLPLAFLTGFFGQNFTWPINHLYMSQWQFLGFAIGLEASAAAIVFMVLRKRGWLKTGPTA